MVKFEKCFSAFLKLIIFISKSKIMNYMDILMLYYIILFDDLKRN